jgi:hypothetical protein
MSDRAIRPHHALAVNCVEGTGAKCEQPARPFDDLICRDAVVAGWNVAGKHAGSSHKSNNKLYPRELRSARLAIPDPDDSCPRPLDALGRVPGTMNELDCGTASRIAPPLQIIAQGLRNGRLKRRNWVGLRP